MRGRPKKYETSADRIAASRAALEASGGTRININLTGEANAAIERLASSTGETKTAIINRLLVAAGQSLAAE